MSTRKITLFENFRLPNFYRSEGFNQVFRKLGYHHMVQAAFVEEGEAAGFYPIWRSADQPPFSCEDIRFLHAIIPHIAHGLNAARLLTRNSLKSTDGTFMPLEQWGAGIVLMDTAGKVIAADESARSLFARLERFDTAIGKASKTCTLAEALDHIARVLNRISRGEEPVFSPSPVVRLHSHWSGVVIRLRGILTPGTAGRDYFTVIIEQGELEEHRLRRIRYRWGLTPQETTIMTALGERQTPAEIAARMNLRRYTLKSYMRRLIEKLDLADTAMLRSFALKNFAPRSPIK